MDTQTPRVRRSLLFAPADRPEIVAKAARAATDVVILELEDGVSVRHKADARNNLEELLGNTDFGGRESAVRINRITTRHGLADLMVLAGIPVKPDLLVLPKVESVDEILIYEELLHNCTISSKLLILIESAKGLSNAHLIASASDRIEGIMFGAVDLAAELGCEMTGEIMAGYRSTMIQAGGYARLPVIDSPSISITDNEHLKEECIRRKKSGFSGKLCIHPSQLDAVNAAFSPTGDEILRAQKIVQAAESAEQGAIVVDGRMVDAPVVKSAQRVLELAKQIGELK